MFSPPIRKEVDFDVGIPRSAVFPRRQVLGAQYGNDELMAHFVIPEFNLNNNNNNNNKRISAVIVVLWTSSF